MTTISGASKPFLQEVGILVWEQENAVRPLLELEPLAGSAPLSFLCLVGIVPSTWDKTAFAHLSALTLGACTIPTDGLGQVLRGSVRLRELTLRSILLTGPPAIGSTTIQLPYLQRLALQGLTDHLAPFIAEWMVPTLSELEIDWHWAEDVSGFATTVSHHLSRVTTLVLSGPTAYPACREQVVTRIKKLGILTAQVKEINLRHSTEAVLEALIERKASMFPKLQTVVISKKMKEDREWERLIGALERTKVQVVIAVANPHLYGLPTSQGAGIPSVE
ncbi:hypothetical protein K438DRAFT_1770771 [Mycena galopus ATCC 62051]|nr:hypothetical protein K438DRAFT_1770771 [Mycena galopus ATCC 62051]